MFCTSIANQDLNQISCLYGFPGGRMIKNLPAKAGDKSSVPELGRSPREVNDNPLQCSGQGNPMDRGDWWAIVMGSQRVRHN